MEKTKNHNKHIVNFAMAYGGRAEIIDAAKKIAQPLKKPFEKTLVPLEMVAILRKHIRSLAIAEHPSSQQTQARREIILSAYQVTVAMDGQQE